MARRSLGLATIVAGAVFLLALVISVDAQYAELIRRLRKPGIDYSSSTSIMLPVHYSLTS